MEASRDKIARIAAGWLGTPFHLNAAARGAGCDCYGLTRGVWKEAGGQVLPPAPQAASAHWREARRLWPAYLAHLQVFAEEIPAGAAGPGDILLFGLPDGAVAHAGLCLEKGVFAHALATGGAVAGVALARYAGAWQARHRRSFRYRETG